MDSPLIAKSRTLTAGTEIDRILALPSRAVLDCSRDILTQRWAPEAQALVEIVTARYARRRLTCGCHARRIFRVSAGRVLVVYPGNQRPETELLLDDFLADSQHDPDLCTRVRATSQGFYIDVPALSAAPKCFDTLYPIQAWALWELPQVRGIYGPISVGGGKTALGLLSPLAAWKCERAAVFIKAQQRIHYHNAYLRVREHFNVPSIVFDKSMISESIAVKGAPQLHVIPYSLLSNTDSTRLLDSLEPDTVIADEAHLLSNRQSARTMRFLRFMTEQSKRRGVTFCAWSGSMINKSIRDCAHLALHALGTGSPYPIVENAIHEWSAIIDPIFNPDRESPMAKRLRAEFGPRNSVERAFYVDLYTNEDIRVGIRERMVVTPGVISTQSASAACSLTISERHGKMGGGKLKLPASIYEAIAGVRSSYVRPDGEEFTEATEVDACIDTLVSGFYHYWRFNHPCKCPSGKPQTCADCVQITRWFAARKEWLKAVRVKKQNGEPHLETVKLCENAAERAWFGTEETSLPLWKESSYLEWREVRDTVSYTSCVRWLDEYLLNDAAEWARTNKGVIWTKHTPFGERLSKISGLPYYAGGDKAQRALDAEDGSRSVIVSIPARGEGYDGLQHHFHKQLIVDFPPSGKGAEQLLGRLARTGQKEDTVETEVYTHVAEFRDHIRKAISLARYDEAMSPNAQLILAADFTFSPGEMLPL